MEVVLALALSVLVLGALGFAIQVNLRATSAGRADVMQAQLARALLDRMAGDLRGAVWYKPPDTSAMMPLASTSSTGGGSGGSSSSGGGSSSGASSGSGGSSGSGQASGGGSRSSGGGAAGGGSSSASSGGSQSSGSGGASGSGGSSSSSAGSSGSSSGQSSSSSGSSVASTTGTEQAPPARFYGGVDWIEFDSTRFPSPTTYAAPAAPNAVPAAIGDVRNVSWFFASTATATSGFVAPQGASGLMRREADGAVARSASENGNASVLDQSAETLAPEVAALQFSYYNGTEWLTDWDSDACDGVPVAVEIAVALVDPSAPPPVQAFSFASPANEQPGYRVYRQLVQLPMASPTTGASSTTESSDASQSDSSQSGSSGSGSTGSSSGQGAQP